MGWSLANHNLFKVRERENSGCMCVNIILYLRFVIWPFVMHWYNLNFLLRKLLRILKMYVSKINDISPFCSPSLFLSLSHTHSLSFPPSFCLDNTRHTEKGCCRLPSRPSQSVHSWVLRREGTVHQEHKIPRQRKIRKNEYILRPLLSQAQRIRRKASTW